VLADGVKVRLPWLVLALILATPPRAPSPLVPRAVGRRRRA